MAAPKKSADYGLLQEFVDSLFASTQAYSRLEVVLEAEAYGLNANLLEIISLLPPATYTREKLCAQLNSSLSSHGWGYVYGAVH